MLPASPSKPGMPGSGRRWKEVVNANAERGFAQMALSRRALWIAAGVVLAVLAVVLIAVYGGDSGGGVGY